MNSLNGLVFNDVELPEELVLQILSYTHRKSILNCKLVCKKWNELIKSHFYWSLRLEKASKKNLPWYVYYSYICEDFDKNLLRNASGENKFENWKIFQNGGDGWRVENPPEGSDPIPESVVDFNGSKCCFATSFLPSSKYQLIRLENKRLRRILDEFQPIIYVSEWYAGRFDCGCKYQLVVRLYDENNEMLYEKEENRNVIQWAGSAWEKVEIFCQDYGPGVCYIEFVHHGSDTQFWKGHFGSKMAGGVVKVLFDSI